MRSVFLPDAFTAAEPTGGWEHGRMALILAGWALIGLVLCLRTFRWRTSAWRSPPSPLCPTAYATSTAVTLTTAGWRVRASATSAAEPP
jgi:hypothetical protein